MNEERSRQEKLKKILFVLLAIGAAMAAVKCIFAGVQRDEEYAFTLSYRLISGDRLLSDIWDPHQTSAFLLSLIEFAFVKMTGGVKYLVLFSRVVGTLLHFAVSFYLYLTLKKFVKREYAVLLSFIYFAMLPKGYVIPEFSLMMSWFTTLLVLLVINTQMSECSKAKRIFNTVLMGIVMCLLVLSYPSCAVVFPIVVVYLLISKSWPKYSCLIFTVTCLTVGGAYLLYLLSYMSVSDVVFSVKSILSSCKSHEGSQAGEYLSNICVLVIITAIEALAGILICLFDNKRRIRKKLESRQISAFSVVCSGVTFAAVIQVLYWIVLIPKYDKEYECSYFFAILVAAVVVLLSGKTEDKEKKELLLFVSVVNIGVFFAIILLTNLNIFASVQYLSSGIVFGLVSLILYAENRLTYEKTVRWLVTIIAFALTMVKGLLYNTDDGLLANFTTISFCVRENEAAKGVFTEYMKGYILDRTKEEWDELIKDGDSVLIWDTSSLSYLNKKVKIGSYTTISTPSYDEESLMNYWNRNPDAYPNVIAVACWYGDLQIEEDSWFYQWIVNEFGASQIIDGKYYRYFIK